MKQNCGNCKWGDFQMTKHNPPRPNPAKFGSCNWPIPSFQLPLSLTSRSNPELRDFLHKSAVWAMDENCFTWEAK